MYIHVILGSHTLAKRLLRLNISNLIFSQYRTEHTNYEHYYSKLEILDDSTTAWYITCIVTRAYMYNDVMTLIQNLVIIKVIYYRYIVTQLPSEILVSHKIRS